MRRTVLILLFLVGCAEPPQAVHEPMTAADGRRAMLITCPRSHGECLAEAASVCPNGYEVLDQSEQQKLRSWQPPPTYASYNGYIVPQQSAPRSWSEYRGEMLVRCGRPPE